MRIEQQERAFEEARGCAERFARCYRALTAVLFGSYARGDFHDGSDLDMVLVSEEFPADYKERNRRIIELSPGGIDIFAYRPEEFLAMLGKNHPTAYWSAREGKVIRDDGFWSTVKNKLEEGNAAHDAE